MQEREGEISTIVEESEISKQYFECFLTAKKRWNIINDGIVAYSFYQDAFNEIKKYNLECMKKGVKIRLITEITKENLFYCKDALPYFSEMSHIDNFTSNSVVSDCCYLQAYEIFKCMPSQCIFSNARPLMLCGKKRLPQFLLLIFLQRAQDLIIFFSLATKDDSIIARVIK